MSATTMNLPCTRFVKRVNNGALGSKYSYIAMMADNAKALESAPWHESAVPIQSVTMPVNKVTETDAKYDESGAMTQPPSFSAFTSDGFDCFHQGGDARKEDGTMCGYAGCVAYRFKIPSSASSVPLSSVSLTVQRDRYCRAGVRVALVLSDETSPSDDWSVVRGEGSGAIVSASTPTDVLGVASWGFLAQSNVPNLVSGRAADGTITFNASGDEGFSALADTGDAYLWVYLTLEDYESYWTMYNSKESRYYSIEGSAMLVASKARFTFGGDVTADTASNPWFLIHYRGDHGGTNLYYKSWPLVVDVDSDRPEISPIFKRHVCAATCTTGDVQGMGYPDLFYKLSQKAVMALYARMALGDGVEEISSNQQIIESNTKDYVEAWQPSATFRQTTTRYSYGVGSYKATFRLDAELDIVTCVIPFGCPSKIHFSRFKFTVSANALSTTGVKLHFWLTRGQYLRSVSEALVSDLRFYRPELGSPSGWELLVPSGSSTENGLTTFTGQLLRPMESEVASLLIVPYIDLSNENPVSQAPTFPAIDTMDDLDDTNKNPLPKVQEVKIDITDIESFYFA